MPYIQLNEKLFSLRTGETSIGTAGADIPVDGPPALGVQAKLQVSNDNSVSIRRASSEAVVRVNGVQLGVEPTPLIHGDKIAIAGAELLFGDDKKSGQTQHLAGLKVSDLLEPGQPAMPGKRTAGTGGRLVSLVDGREYTVGPTGVTIGRDAGCDVVVPSPEVSRKHAELVPGSDSYAVSDLSTNGVFVNGVRVKGSQTLARGDVIRVGTEEFRFYADVARASGERPVEPHTPGELPPLPPTARVSTPVPGMPTIGRGGPATPVAPHPKAAPAPAPAPAAPVAETASGAFTASQSPAAPPPGSPTSARDTRPVLATLEIMNEGAMKGTRFELRAPLTHVGRGAHNDIVLTDDTVSDSHAKIQKREGGWFVVDMGSSNGTYCGGQRIAGEASLTGATSLRFGGIRVSFVPAQEARQDSSGTRVIHGLNVEQARKMSREPAAPPPATEDTPKPSGVPMWVWVVVLLLVGAGAFFILKVR
jgi:pSer/pThr/pTyr-binding forkhead associated (FHA) protein